MDHAVQQRRRCPGAERALARGGEGQDRPQAEDVARRPDFITGGLLGGHEPGRADHQACLRQRRGFHRAGDAEVDDPRAVLGYQHVRRLEVPVHHARGVDRAQALDLPPEPIPELRIRRQLSAHDLDRDRPPAETRHQLARMTWLMGNFPRRRRG